VLKVEIGLILAAAAIWVLPKPAMRRKILLFLVGVTAGLERAQVHKIHVVVFVVILLVTVGREGLPLRFTRHNIVIVASTVLLCLSVPLGSLVNSDSYPFELILLSLVAAAVVATVQPGEAKIILGGLLALVSFGSFWAMLQYLHIIRFVLFQGTARPRGIYSEPDWLGLYSAIGVLLAIRAPLRWWNRLFLMMLCAAACGLSGARAAWLGLGVVAVAAGLAAFFKRKVPDRRAGNVRLLAIFALAGLTLLAVDGKVRSAVAVRFESVSPNSTAGLNVGTSTYSSSKVRVNELQAMLNLVENAPWHGWGLSADGRVEPTGKIQYTGTAKHNVGSDWLLGTLLDGGLLSLPFVILLLYAAFRRVPRTPCLVLLLVLVASLLSNAIAFPITWVSLGLVMAMLADARARPAPRMKPSLTVRANA
jgi:O-antigen ligase/polysaccharide polymerase Wzy-like membrane protein